MPEYEIKNEVKTYEDLRALMEKSGHEFDYDLIDRAYHVEIGRASCRERV